MAVASDARERIEVVFGRLASVDLAAASIDDCDRVLADVARVKRWAAAFEAKAAVERDRRFREGGRRTPEPEPEEPSDPDDLEPVPGPTPIPGRSSKEDAQTKAVRRVIELLPLFGDALEAGELTVQHLVVVDRFTNRARLQAGEAELLAAAKERTAETFTTWLTRWDADRDLAAGITKAKRQRARRGVSMWAGLDDMGELRATLRPADFDALKRSLYAIDAEIARTTKVDPTASWNQRLADALVEMMHRANSVTSGTVAAAGGSLRTAVVVFIDYETLATGLGYGVTADNMPIPASEIRTMAAEAHIIPMVMSQKSEVLDMGIAQRYANDAHWLALMAEQGGCWNFGCEHPVGTIDAHHCDEYATGGPTDLINLGAGCRTDHRGLHARGDKAEKIDGRIHITHPDGTVTISPNRRDRTPPKPPPPHPRE